MKRIKLTHGTARVEDDCSPETIKMLDEMSKIAYNHNFDKMKGKETDWVNYRQLKKGEMIEQGDEVLISSKEGWIPATCIGGLAPDPKYTAHRIYRRPKQIL